MILVLPGCKSSSNTIPEASIVITDLNQYYGFNKNGAELESVSTQCVYGKLANTGLMNRFTKENDQFLISKSTTDKSMKQYLIAVDKSTGEVKETEPHDGEFYSICVDGDMIYTVSASTNSITLRSYSQDLKLVKSAQVPLDAAMVIPTGICKYQNTIYVLCGFVNADAAYGTVSNKLVSVSPDFEYLDTIDLGLNDGAWKRRVF